MNAQCGRGIDDALVFRFALFGADIDLVVIQRPSHLNADRRRRRVDEECAHAVGEGLDLRIVHAVVCRLCGSRAPLEDHLARLAMAAEPIGPNGGRIARELAPRLSPLHRGLVGDGHRLALPVDGKVGILNRQQCAGISRQAQKLPEVLARQRLSALLDGAAELRDIRRGHIVGNELIAHCHVPGDNLVHGEDGIWRVDDRDLFAYEFPAGTKAVGNKNLKAGAFVSISDLGGRGTCDCGLQIVAAQDDVIDRQGPGIAIEADAGAGLLISD